MKPSDIYNDTTGNLHRKAAQEANRKRAERKATQKRAEQEAKWEEENRVAEEAARRRAQEDARREADKRMAEEEARIKAEEEAMWASMDGSTKKERTKKESTKSSGTSGTKIRVTLDGEPVDNLSAAMALIDTILFGKRNDFRDSEWTKINRKLKKDGVITYRGHVIELI